MTATANPFGKILIYLNGSESSILAAKFAIALSARHRSLLKAIYVVNDNLLTELLKARIFVQVEKMDYERDLEEDGKRYLNYVVKLGEKKGVKVETLLRKGIVHDVVGQEIEHCGCDLLIQGELGEVLSLRDAHYEEGERILRRATCPVLVVRDKQKVEKLYDSIEDGGGRQGG
ncbi:MAG: universal stress protein [Candidatus Krumholzibacteria bacterium]|nr:universal stress protein [Candidatus Krumholzibacteria bacterium]